MSLSLPPSKLAPTPPDLPVGTSLAHGQVSIAARLRSGIRAVRPLFDLALSVLLAVFIVSIVVAVLQRIAPKDRAVVEMVTGVTSIVAVAIVLGLALSVGMGPRCTECGRR